MYIFFLILKTFLEEEVNSLTPSRYAAVYMYRLGKKRFTKNDLEVRIL